MALNSAVGRSALVKVRLRANPGGARAGGAGVGRAWGAPGRRVRACAPGRGGRASWLSRARAELQASSGRDPAPLALQWDTCGFGGQAASGGCS